MQYRIIISTLITAITVAACSKQEPAPNQSLNCDQPQLADSIQRQLQQHITHNAQWFAQHDERHFVDADKIIAAASQLNVSLTPLAANDGQTQSTQCRGELKITIPDNILQLAQTNTPLLFGQTTLAQQLNQQIEHTNIKFNDHSFIQELNYPPHTTQSASDSLMSTVTSLNLEPMSQILQTTLLPYGVKDILVINGKAYSRDEARAQLLNPTLLSPEAQMASAILNGDTTQPDSNTLNDHNRVSMVDTDLQQARDNNRNAQNELERLWHSLNKTVQETLASEQQQWQQQQKQQCQHSDTLAAKEAELSHLQCETRLINQRLHYLRGYSLS